MNEFENPDYLRHNKVRQEHLASLGLDLDGKTVLELGAGQGDHTQFWLDRGCDVIALEGRRENAAVLRQRYGPSVRVYRFDVQEGGVGVVPSDIVYAYGILYHLPRPVAALRLWVKWTAELLLVETCVNTDLFPSLYFVEEDPDDPRASLSGKGCRPSRQWVFNELSAWFDYVYMPVTQPDHPEFPTDWKNVTTDGLTRAVFIAAWQELDLPTLTPTVPEAQEVFRCPNSTTSP